jgi:dTDP-L-rhamnose 4-epimerase
MKGSRVLITGGAGFIGSRLSRALSALGAQCWVFDNLHPQVHGPAAKPPDLGPRTVFLLGDVTDAPALSSALAWAQPEVVYHLASETGTGQSREEPARYCEVNVTGTARLVEAMRVCRTPARRLVLASSRAIYGEGAYRTGDGRIVSPPPRTVVAMAAGRFDPEIEGLGPLTPQATSEALPPNPSSVYASTKLMQEHLVCQTQEGAPWSAGILRLQNVYGPGQSLGNAYTGILSIFTATLRAGERLNIYEDGAIVRDFVYVDDVVQALTLAGESDHRNFTLNIGSGEPITLLEAGREVARALGHTGDEALVSGNFRAGDVRHALADIRSARQVLGWEPSTRFGTGVRRLVEWAIADVETSA